jgi:hypothetical protein
MKRPHATPSRRSRQPCSAFPTNSSTRYFAPPDRLTLPTVARFSRRLPARCVITLSPVTATCTAPAAKRNGGSGGFPSQNLNWERTGSLRGLWTSCLR